MKVQNILIALLLYCILVPQIMAEGDDEPPARTNDTARLHAQLDAELQAEREAASASSATSSEKRA